jgi:hypothetical protein
MERVIEHGPTVHGDALNFNARPVVIYLTYGTGIPSGWGLAGCLFYAQCQLNARAFVAVSGGIIRRGR